MTIQELLALPREEQLSFVRRLRALIEKASAFLSDEDALNGIELFAPWKENTWYNLDDRICHEEKLYRVRQGHTSSALNPPGSEGTQALYAEVAAPGQGETPNNPIEYNNNMTLEEGKYYTQNNVIYICIRDTINPVYSNLADLVGLYVNIYE